MPKLPANFDWRKSPAHMDLLITFIKPRDVAQILDWQYLKETIKESPQAATDRFIQDGALVPCSLEEILSRVFKVSDLKEKLKERSLKQAGNKAALISRLVDADRSGMEAGVSKLKVMKCSEAALALISQYKENKQRAIDLAKQQSYEALSHDNPKEAYKIYVTYHRQYTNPQFVARPDEAEELGFILSSWPKALATISSSDLVNLRAAAGLAELWNNESATSWLPDNLSTPVKNSEVALNYLTRNAEFKKTVTRCSSYAKQVRVLFNEYDIDSCELCLALKGKAFDISDFPELPFENCTSETGCMCDIDCIYEGEVLEVTIADTVEGLEERDDFGEDDSVTKLKQLKEMLDNDLITEVDYQKKKAEILSRM